MNKKYWLWTGIVFALLSILASGLWMDSIGHSKVITILYLPAIIAGLSIFGMDATTFQTQLVLTVYAFLVGALIGWIYGKIKGRKA